MNPIRIIAIITVVLGTSGFANASSYDLSGFVDANSGAKVKAFNIYGSDARVMFHFIKNQTPSTYSKYSGATYSFEHVRGKEVFCARDTLRDASGKIYRLTYRCDFTLSGEGELAPKLRFQDSYPGWGGAGEGN